MTNTCHTPHFSSKPVGATFEKHPFERFRSGSYNGIMDKQNSEIQKLCSIRSAAQVAKC